MTKGKTRFTSAIVLALPMLSIWTLWDDVFLDHSSLFYVVMSSAYALTLFGLFRMSRSGQRLHTLLLIPCAVALTVVMFWLWGTVLSLTPPGLPSDLPLSLRWSRMFIGGPLAALAVALLLFFPLTILMPRTFWLVSTITGLFVAAYQFPELSKLDTASQTLHVMVYELLCLLLVVPLLVWFMGSRVRQKNRIGIRERSA